MPDAFADNVVLHLPMEPWAPGADVIVDWAPYRRAISRLGGVGLAAGQVKYGTRACFFDGAGDYLFVPYDLTLSFNSVDFAIEFWYFSVATSGLPTLLDFRGSNLFNVSWALAHDAGAGSLFIYDGPTSAVISSPGGIIANAAWNHVAIVRAGTAFTYFVNGVAVFSATYNPPATHSSGIRIGSNHADANYLNGYLDDLRITKGVARYSANFTPPAAIEYDATVRQSVDVPLIDSFFGPPTQNAVATSSEAMSDWRDYYYGGRGKIGGTVKEKAGASLVRRVRLHESRSGCVIGEQWSDNGDYLFENLSRDFDYYVVGFDHTSAYQGVVADRLVPEAM